MSDYRFCVSLRITHPNMDPEVITKKLQIDPFRIWKYGEQRISPKGSLLEGVNKESFWAAKMHSEKRLLSTDIYIEEYLVKLNKKLSPFSQYFSDIVKSGGYVEYFIGWFSADNVGVTFDTALMNQTADLNISIGIDAYICEE